MKHSIRSLTHRSLFLILLLAFAPPGQAGEITGRIVDSATGEPVEARLTIVSTDGKTHHLAESTGREGLGAAVPYEKRRGEESVEVHTALSADPFRADLPPGRYRLTAARGHEYRPAMVEIEVSEESADPEPVELKLERWIDLNARGWFSGDVHCHLPREGLETVLRAADLNVTFPLSAWVTDTAHRPDEDNKVSEEAPRPHPILAGENRLIWPVNTEYELFTREGEKHPLGALLVLRHREPLDLTVPPVGPMIDRAREQGAVFDLDKHNWPWSMMLPAIGAVDLFELSNNHVWETTFGVTNWHTEYVPEYAGIAVSEDGHLDERGWLEFGFQNWYALLNCGLRIAPSAGTGSGVHPVALGFGRVYVRLPEREFDLDEWMDGLKAGRSFVTTGPMLFATVDEAHPGSRIEWTPPKKAADGEMSGIPVIVRVESEQHITALELIVNGDRVALEIGGSIGARATHSAMAQAQVAMERSGWIAARVFAETAEGRPRFAHTAPVWVEVKDKPALPKLAEVDYLLGRVEAEIERHRDKLSEEAVAEFEQAAEFYREKRKAVLDSQ